MDEQKEHEKNRDEEMKGARGLPSSEGGHGPRHSCIESGGQRQPGPDRERNQYKDNKQVSDALQNVARAEVGRRGRRQAKVLRDHAAESTPRRVCRSWKQVLPEVAR